MNVLSLDVETTTYNKGNPFDPRNVLCTVASPYNCWPIEYPNTGLYGHHLDEIKRQVFQTDVLVGFNIKFDLHWLRHYGITEFQKKAIWDVQIAEYIISGQQDRMLSLNEVLEKYGLPLKFDKVKDYWDRGIQTTEIPFDLLVEYNIDDSTKTLEVFHLQYEKVRNTPLENLIWVSGMDLLTLQEMEYNGIKWEVKRSRDMARELSKERDQIADKIQSRTPEIPVNLNSPAHVSALLFGGSYEYEIKVQDYKILKDGRTKPYLRTERMIATFPRIVEPLKNKKNTKGYSVDEDHLVSVKKFLTVEARSMVKDILRYREIDKFINTYLLGIPLKIEEMNWQNNIMHGQFNQVTTRTGRLSSNEPNLQNLSGDSKELVVTRYE